MKNFKYVVFAEEWDETEAAIFTTLKGAEEWMEEWMEEWGDENKDESFVVYELGKKFEAQVETKTAVEITEVKSKK